MLVPLVAAPFEEEEVLFTMRQAFEAKGREGGMARWPQLQRRERDQLATKAVAAHFWIMRKCYKNDRYTNGTFSTCCVFGVLWVLLIPLITLMIQPSNPSYLGARHQRHQISFFVNNAAGAPSQENPLALSEHVHILFWNMLLSKQVRLARRQCPRCLL